jgi:ABC-type thiamine transport system ATPase subunit
VEINFPGTKRLSTLQTSKRVPIQEAFADAFPEQLLDEPIVAPETIKLDALRDRMLKLVHFNAENSWLTLGFNESESPAGE